MAAISTAPRAWWPGWSRSPRSRALGITLDCDLTVMGIRAEESIWFQVSYIGSRGASARCRMARWMCAASTPAAHWPNTSLTVAAILKRCARGARFLDPRPLRAYLELHIEQAPSLVEAGRPVGICTGIPGNFRYPDARIEGSHDHVGLPRRFRRDAAMAGAEFAMALDRVVGGTRSEAASRWPARSAGSTPTRRSTA